MGQHLPASALVIRCQTWRLCVYMRYVDLDRSVRSLVDLERSKAISRVSGRSKAVEVERKASSGGELPFICHGDNCMTDGGLLLMSGDRKL